MSRRVVAVNGDHALLRHIGKRGILVLGQAHQLELRMARQDLDPVAVLNIDLNVLCRKLPDDLVHLLCGYGDRPGFLDLRGIAAAQPDLKIRGDDLDDSCLRR